MMTLVKVVNELDGVADGAVWDLYTKAFEGLDALTVQRHLMYRHEFTEVMADPRIEKYLAYDDGDRLVGLSTYTNRLDAWPLISPAYFARRWPTHYAQRRIFYCGFVAVPGHDPGAFSALVEAMYRRAETQDGVIALDICLYNIEVHRLDRAIRLMLNRISGGRVVTENADAQTFWVYQTAPESAR